MYTYTYKTVLSRENRTVNLTKCFLLKCNLKYAAFAET